MNEVVPSDREIPGLYDVVERGRVVYADLTTVQLRALAHAGEIVPPCRECGAPAGVLCICGRHL